jgi:catechol 2,3-dioxygenase-like lactoylglutathione lyase family enzyme
VSLPPLALNHLNLPARDPVALRRWYVDTLGFRANGPFLWSAGTLLVFARGEPLPGGDFHLGFRVGSLADLEGWVARLRGAGVAVGDVEGDAAYSTARLLDPEGNEIELFYELEPREPDPAREPETA